MNENIREDFFERVEMINADEITSTELIAAIAILTGGGFGFIMLSNYLGLQF